MTCLSSKGKRAWPCPTSGRGQGVVGVGVSREELETVGKLAAAMSSGPSSCSIRRFPVWPAFCEKQTLICSDLVALALVSLCFLWI